MNKYIFRVIFYTTITLISFALGVDYANSEISAILILFSLIGVGSYISYKELHGKTDKETFKILGVPESWIC